MINVDAARNQRAINPNIYGVNAAGTADLKDLHVSFNRAGGNLYSRYNWQIDASNHGSDFFFESLSDGSGTPAESSDQFLAGTKLAGAEPTVTIPTIGWVAKLGLNRSPLASFSVTKYGLQQKVDPNFPDAGNGVRPDGTLITNNDANDANVQSNVAFQSSWVQHIVNRFGQADQGGIRYYTLDNEPGIWHDTHRDVHPIGARLEEVRDYLVDYAAMIKSADPGAKILGPEEWGYLGYLYSGFDKQFGEAYGFDDPPDRRQHGNTDQIPYLLDQMNKNEQLTGKRLLDYLTVHYYPQGEYRINEVGDLELVRDETSNDVSRETQLLRNRSTRSLWDPEYVDVSYIGLTLNDNKVQLIPRLKRWVNTFYAGSLIGVSEYDWGAPFHMNGATAQADVLGIFGREGLDLANRYSLEGPLGLGGPVAGTPVYNAFKMYRNYDGRFSTFGDLSVDTSVPNWDELAAFSAVRSSDGALTVMVVDKSLVDPGDPEATDEVTVNLSNFADSSVVQFYLLSAPDPTDLSKSLIRPLADGAVTGSSFTVSVPRQSVLLAIVPAVGARARPWRPDSSGRHAVADEWWVGVSPASVLTSSNRETRSPTAKGAEVPGGGFDGEGFADLTARERETSPWWANPSTGAAFTTARRVTRSRDITWRNAEVGGLDGDGQGDITRSWA
jgi:hypothetical protein